MTSSTAVTERVATDGPIDLTTGPLLIAVDGREDSAAILRAGRAIAVRLGATPQVIAVVEPLPIHYADVGLTPLPIEVVEERKAALRERVRRQLGEAIGAAPDWTLEVATGNPARTIAEIAHDSGARLVVMGLGSHRPLDRVFGSETALHTMRLADRSVLAIPPGVSELPTRAVAAVDFSAASVRAAEEALALLTPGGTLTLVHVLPLIEEFLREDAETWNLEHRARVEDLLERVRAGLHVPHSITVNYMIRTGQSAREVLTVAAELGADLVAAGNSGAGFIERLRVGSVSTQLLRRTRVALLLTPRPSAADATRLESMMANTAGVSPVSGWPALVEAFSRRNVGRPTRLEIDDPEIGAQLQEYGLALLGATYDHREDRLDLMLGDAEGKTRALSHGIRGVSSIDVLSDSEGQDRALRAQHGRGQTILMFRD